MTSFILEGVTEGLFIVVFEDKSGGKTHTIGINRGLNIIYDYMEHTQTEAKPRESFKMMRIQSRFCKIILYSRTQR